LLYNRYPRRRAAVACSPPNFKWQKYTLSVFGQHFSIFSMQSSSNLTDDKLAIELTFVCRRNGRQNALPDRLPEVCVRRPHYRVTQSLPQPFSHIARIIGQKQKGVWVCVVQIWEWGKYRSHIFIPKGNNGAAAMKGIHRVHHWQSWRE
jgi:hypothetical protein